MGSAANEAPKSPETLDAVADALRAAMRRLVSTVTILTTTHEGRPWGLTVSAFTSVCLEPPTVLVCVNASTTTARHIAQQGRFGINVLADHQADVSARQASPGAPKFLTDVDLAEPLEGWATPRLAGALAALDARVQAVHEVGTHLVAIARVVGVHLTPDAQPLLYGDGRYLDPTSRIHPALGGAAA